MDAEILEKISSMMTPEEIKETGDRMRARLGIDLERGLKLARENNLPSPEAIDLPPSIMERAIALGLLTSTTRTRRIADR